jgi:type IV secretion system protein VirD4
MAADVMTRPKVVSGLLAGLAAGLVLANGYVAFHSGLTVETFQQFSLLSLWHETPIYQDGVTPTFFRAIGTLVVTTVAVFAAICVALAETPRHHGTARWATFSEMKRFGYLKAHTVISGPVFGKTARPRRSGDYLTNGEHAHSLIVAPTRAGKGVGIVIPTLLTFKGSVLALDVKGELFELTSRARRDQGHKIFKFAPFDPEGRSHSYNPVEDVIAVPPGRRFSEARRLAVNLITAKGKGAEGFLDGARDLFVAGVLACIEQGTPSIGAVYDLFSQPGEKYKLFAKLAEETQIAEVRRIFDNMAANDSKIITSYTSVLGDGGLNLWADPLIRAATSKSDFSIYSLRSRPSTIYLCVSPNDLIVIAPLIRLFFQQVVSILQRTMPTPREKCEVLFLLDEFKHLGKLESIETAITTIAGYNGRFMFIIQSLSALTGGYEQAGKENFLSNTGVQIFMATADDETPNYISKAIGEYTYSAKSHSFRRGHLFESNVSVSEQGGHLIRPEQVRLLDESEEIVLVKGRPPMKINKIKYYEDKVLSRIFNSQVGLLPEPEPMTI